MKTALSLVFFLILCLIIVVASPVRRLDETGSSRSMPNTAPTLINTCLVTNDVNRLAAFYAQVLGIEPHRVDATYVEFRTSKAVLALFAAEAQEKYIPGSTMAGQNHSAILEFRVSDVDREYARLNGLVQHWVKGPTTQPWGTRSIYFRDPDGNLVDFSAPVAP
jgi:catechol 2,3-dioxygenase-like lactoylglutathione lyase family enzyme